MYLQAIANVSNIEIIAQEWTNSSFPEFLIPLIFGAKIQVL